MASLANILRNLKCGRRDTDDLFIDWGDQETYSLKLGRGECAA